MIAAMSAPPPAAVYPANQLISDPVAPYPQLVQARQAATAGDWALLRRTYDETDTWASREGLVRTVSEVAGVEELLERAVAEDGDDQIARLMLAVRHVEMGWQIRSGYRAQHVSAEQFAAFHEQLRIAERSLIEITARDPGNLAAWCARLVTARGLQLGQAEARRRYDQVARHDPHLYNAQSQLLQQLCPKWSGRVEELFAFVRERVAAAPDGSLSPVLIVIAHLERSADENFAPDKAYLADAAVQEEVGRAAARSVLHPAFQPVYPWVTVHSYFALYHSLIGRFPAAAVHFRAMGPYVSYRPWEGFFGAGEKEFRRSRARALAKG
jgi:hypothetical protein